jgi:hypothetical protein
MKAIEGQEMPSHLGAAFNEPFNALVEDNEVKENAA